MYVTDYPADEVPQYVAGFFDGDGCVSLSGDRLMVGFGQCDVLVLQWIQQQLGIGRITLVRAETLTQRRAYYLRCYGFNALTLLRTMRPFLHVKAHAADIAIEYITTIGDTPAHVAKKRQLHDLLSEENNKQHRTVIQRPDMTPAYVAGLLDAEGCVRHNKVSIAQKQDPSLLRELAAYFGGVGTITDTAWTVSRQEVMIRVLQQLLPYLTGKRAQAELALAYFVNRGAARPRLSRVIDELARLKRINRTLTRQDLERINNAAPPPYAGGRHLAPERGAAEQADRERRSRLCPTQVGPRTSATTCKAVQSMVKNGTTGRKVTDDQIEAVKLAHEETGKSMRSIARDMHLHAAQVSNICNGTMLSMAQLAQSNDPVQDHIRAREAAKIAAKEAGRAQSDATIALKRASRILAGNNNRKVSDVQIQQVRALLATGVQNKVVADKLGVAKQTVSKVKNRVLLTANEARQEARDAGVWVDGVTCVDNKGHTTHYTDIWAAAKSIKREASEVHDAVVHKTRLRRCMWNRTDSHVS
jgi:DNA invertase Pin-like site-specific DNA recombinase